MQAFLAKLLYIDGLPINFIDTQFFIHKMIKLKNFVLIADIHRSISLIKFQQEYTKLSFIAKVNISF